MSNAIRRIGGLESPTAKIDGIDERVNIDVAVIDTGIQPDHPDLNVVGGYNCVGNGNASAWADKDGHGTMVAGFIGALDNDLGVVGVAPGARLWALRVQNKKETITDTAVWCALYWVSQHSDVIDVVNMSIVDPDPNRNEPCGPKGKDRLHEAICDLVRKGVTVVVGAGNDAMDTTTFTPAAWPEVITVSALADNDGQPGGLGGSFASTSSWCDPAYAAYQDDHMAGFSNFGAAVDIAAPGVCIQSTWPGSQYLIWSGTSFATPLVSGAAALYLSTHPSATPAQVRGALAARAEPGPIPGDPDAYPEGVLNVRGL